METAVIELRNKTRSVFRFPCYEVQGKGPDAVLVAHTDKDLVIGDSADETLEDGVERSHLTPSPIVRVSEADLEALGPANKAMLERLVADGQIERRKVA